MSKKALIVCGGWEGHEPRQVSEVFKEILVDEGFEVEISNTLESFSDENKLKELNLIIPNWTMGQIKDEYVKNICNAVESGVGLAGCHGGMCDAFRESVDWHFLTGSQWVAHPGNEVDYTVNIKKSSSSPIISGIEDFFVRSEQYYIHVDPAVDVLATTKFVNIPSPQTTNGKIEVPVVYTKLWGKGRVFYNSLGHNASLFNKIKEARLLMKNGFTWAAR